MAKAENKMNKREFIAHMAEMNGVSEKQATDAYTMVMNSIQDAVASGVRLSLMGFGTFYLQTHKGHPVQFEGDTGTDRVHDYEVFKFSASNALNKRIRDRRAVVSTVIG